jgi:hypothetical protein
LGDQIKEEDTKTKFRDRFRAAFSDIHVNVKSLRSLNISNLIVKMSEFSWLRTGPVDHITAQET